jgi:hypothetical protein
MNSSGVDLEVFRRRSRADNSNSSKEGRFGVRAVRRAGEDLL